MTPVKRGATSIPPKNLRTLPETNIAPENGWLEYYIVSFWEGLFSGAMLVVGRVIPSDSPITLNDFDFGMACFAFITSSGSVSG